MPRARHKSIRLTPFQTEYLRELVDDDVAETDLTHEERNAAYAVIDRLDSLRDRFNSETEEEDDEGEVRPEGP